MIKILLFAFALFFCFQPAYADFRTVAPMAEKAGWKAKDYKKTFRLGLKGHGKKMPLKALEPARAAKALPSSLDYRAQGFVSPIRDQGDCGSCWAFSAVGALESATMIAKSVPGAALDLSEQIVVSCDTGNDGCDGGYMDAVSDFLASAGTGLESCYPYAASKGSCSQACVDRHSYKASSWGYAATVSPSLEAIKTALADYGPLATTLYVYSDFLYYESGVYKYTYGSLQGGHAVIIVGYDDAAQAFTVKNSWGTGWGEAGYFRIAYSELSSRVKFGEETIYYRVALPPADCKFSVGYPSADFPSSGGTGSVRVNASRADCPWTVQVSVPWITIAGGGIGTVDLSYSVAANASTDARTGIVTLAGIDFTVNQAGATPGCNSAQSRTPGANAIRPWWKIWK